MKHLHICHVGQRDNLVWSMKMKTGNIIVVDTYNFLSSREAQQGEHPVLYAFCRTKIPIKNILFSWLVYHNKNLTWENLHKRQWHGPSICTICRMDVENNNHMFLKCQHTLQVSKKLSSLIGFPYIQYDCIVDSMKWWSTQKIAWRIIPLFLF